MRWRSAYSLTTGTACTRDLGVLASKNPEDSNVARVEAMELVLLYVSIGHDSCY
jgi:hypothetical protein